MSLACLFLLRPRASARQHPEPLPDQLVEGWQAFRSRRWLWVTVARGGLTPLLIAVGAPLPVVLAGSFVSGTGVAGFISLFDTVWATASRLALLRVRDAARLQWAGE